jgi:hypothetical protein
MGPIAARRPTLVCLQVLGFAALLALHAGNATAAQVVEFYNTPLDNYFITADPVEAAAVDAGAAGPGWARTGDSFNFNSGGITPVCRFYGSISPGPNSHFYTAIASECNQLKQLQASTPPTQKRWNFESLDFVTTAPVAGGCPPNTIPVYRAYNNGSVRGVDSNHRITASAAGIQAVVARGWVSEGIVMCGATDANVAAADAFVQSVGGVWQLLAGGQLQPIVFRFMPDGGYLQGQANGPTPGLERGRFAYDARTKQFGGVVVQDTNGDAGLSNRNANEITQTIALENNVLVVRNVDNSESARLQRVTDNPESIVGAWAAGSESDLYTQHFVFFPDGHYMMIDPIGSEDNPACGPPGIEYGTYTWTPATGTLTITGVTIDTNRCAGLNDSTGGALFEGVHAISGIQLSDDGGTASIGGQVMLYRVSLSGL